MRLQVLPLTWVQFKLSFFLFNINIFLNMVYEKLYTIFFKVGDKNVSF